MQRFSLLVTSLGIILAATAQPAAQSRPLAPLAVGDRFPRLEGEFLTGRQAILPDAASGKYALVLLGFTYDSRFVVEQWAEHVRPEFAKKDRTFFEVPVLGGLARLGKWFIDSGMRSGTPKELHEHVITLWGEVDRWKTVMKFSDAAPNDAYLALFDPTGRVLWLHHGPYTADAFDAMLRLAGG